MRKKPVFVLAALLGVSALFLGTTTRVHSQRPPARESFAERLARLSQVDERDAVKVYDALGAAIALELSEGKQIGLPGLGTFRIVRLPERKDLQNGRPVTLPAVNRIEFVASIDLADVANAPGAIPAETVPQFEYIPVPGQTPSQRTVKIRTLPMRTK